MNLRFYESLCSSNEKVLKMCSDLKKYGIIYDHFVSNGFVKIITSADDNPLKIKNPKMLHDLFQDFYKYEELLESN